MFYYIVGVAYLVILIYIIVSIINDPTIDNKNVIFWIVMLVAYNFIGLVVYLITEDKEVLF